MLGQFPLIFGVATIVLIAIIATPVALYAWMTSPAKVLAEIDALDLDAATKAILKSCCGSAKAADNKVRFYDLTAPIVMLLVPHQNRPESNDPRDIADFVESRCPRPMAITGDVT